MNWHNLLLDEKQHSVRFEHEGMRIDLGGIAKGYAVDRGIGILQTHGVQHAVVTAVVNKTVLMQQTLPPK